MPRRRRPGTALVRGPSMRPLLRDGDAVALLWGGRVRPGDVVVARPLARPELLVVKRARAEVGDGVWDVGSDDPTVAGRGWTGGPAEVLGRVVLRWWPLPPRRVR